MLPGPPGDFSPQKASLTALRLHTGIVTSGDAGAGDLGRGGEGTHMLPLVLDEGSVAQKELERKGLRVGPG